MNIELLKEFLLWCLVINYSLLITWFLVFWRRHDWLYQFHSTWFSISVKSFDAMHYQLIGVYKILVFVFNLIPLVALHLI